MMSMWRSLVRIPLLCSVVAAVALLAACGGSDTETEDAAPPTTAAEPAGGDTGASGGADDTEAGDTASASDAEASGNIDGEKVFILGCTNSNPWCNGFNTTLQEELSKAGAQVTLLTSNFNAAEQNQQMAQAISQSPAAILIHVADPNALIPSLRQAQNAGVPVIPVDTNVGEEALELVAANLMPDHADLGRFAAINCQEGLEAQGITEGNVILITGTGSQIHVQTRIEAFKDQLAETPGLKIVEIQDANWDPIETATIAQQLFAKYRNQGGIQCAYGMADYQAAAIARVAQQSGIPLYPADGEGLVVTGSNCASDGIEAIRNGLMYGGATQSPILEARDFVPFVIQVINGEDIGEQITTPVDRITEENVDEYADVCTY